MGQSVGAVLNVTDYVFPASPASYDDSHDLLVRFPLWAEADVPAILLPPAVCGSWRGPVASAGTAVAVCVLYFHANSCDIGECVADAAAIRDGVFGGDAVVLAPEYPGYGLLSDFEPSVAGIDMVAQAAWRFCCEDLGFLPTQVVLWGRSIGTGPASALACSCAVTACEHGRSRADRPLGALVLLAPFTSVSEVVLAHSNSLVASLVDPMWNVSRLVGDEGLKEVPLCVVHPKDDEVIPLEQGLAVLDGAAAQLKFGLWLSGAGHNFGWTRECAEAVRGFLCEHLRGGESWGERPAVEGSRIALPGPTLGVECCTEWCWEYGSVVLNPIFEEEPGVGELRVTSAWFGDPGELLRRRDITAEVRELLANALGQPAEVTATTQLWGDPAPLRVKLLKVTYERLWLTGDERGALEVLQRRAFQKLQGAHDLEELLQRLGNALLSASSPVAPQTTVEGDGRAATAESPRGEPSVSVLSVPIGRTSPRWRQLGFQSSDPCADLRTGRLALEALLYLAERYPLATGQMVRESQSDGLDYPFALASINVTQVLARYLGLTAECPSGVEGASPTAPRHVVRRFARLLLRKDSAYPDPFGELHAAVVAHLHTAWRLRKVRDPGMTVMDFGPALGDTLSVVRRFCSEAPLESAAEFGTLLEVAGLGEEDEPSYFRDTMHETVRAVSEQAANLRMYFQDVFT